jgi:hypothetical protein
LCLAFFDWVDHPNIAGTHQNNLKVLYFPLFLLNYGR